MEDPGKPHVRAWEGSIYVERVPGYWVQVCPIEEWNYLNEPEKRYVTSRALKHGSERQLPPKI